jgi:hypothetical protein
MQALERYSLKQHLASALVRNMKAGTKAPAPKPAPPPQVNPWMVQDKPVPPPGMEPQVPEEEQPPPAPAPCELEFPSLAAGQPAGSSFVPLPANLAAQLTLHKKHSRGGRPSSRPQRSLFSTLRRQASAPAKAVAASAADGSSAVSSPFSGVLRSATSCASSLRWSSSGASTPGLDTSGNSTPTASRVQQQGTCGPRSAHF